MHLNFQVFFYVKNRENCHATLGKVFSSRGSNIQMQHSCNRHKIDRENSEKKKQIQFLWDEPKALERSECNESE